MGLASLVTLPQVLAAEPSIASWDQTQAASLLLSACAVADRYIGRNLASASATEWYDGAKSVYLNLNRFPVSESPTPLVYYDRTGGRGQIPGTFGTDTLLTIGVDYVINYDKAIITLIRYASGGNSFERGYPWPTITSRYGRGLVANYVPTSWGQSIDSVKVTYTAGYATLPLDLLPAIVQLMTYMYRINPLGGVVAKSVSFIDVTDSIEVTQALSKLRGGIPELGTSREILDSYRVPYTGSWIL